MHMNQKQSIFGSVFRSKTARQEEKQMIAEAEELLRTMIQQEEYKKGKLMPNEVELS